VARARLDTVWQNKRLPEETMPADAAKLPPFRKLPFKAPDMDVRRGEGGVVYLSSRTPLGPVPRSIPHVLDERAAEHPDRPWLKQRLPNHGDWRAVTKYEGYAKPAQRALPKQQ